VVVVDGNGADVVVAATVVFVATLVLVVVVLAAAVELVVWAIVVDVAAGGASEVSEPDADTGGEPLDCTVVADGSSSVGVLAVAPHAAVASTAAATPAKILIVIMPRSDRRSSHMLPRRLIHDVTSEWFISDQARDNRDATVERRAPRLCEDLTG